MPLTILLILVIGGIAGIAALLHLLGLSKPVVLTDEQAATQAWLREFPDDIPTKVVLCHDHHAALITTAKGQGIVWPMGADTTARYLSGAHVRQTKNGLAFDLPDFTAPHIHLTLDADEVAKWPTLLKDPA